jgi:hypothetical protein
MRLFDTCAGSNFETIGDLETYIVVSVMNISDEETN